MPAVPPYRRVADELRRRIRAGDHVPGDRLPSYRLLAEELGVERGVVQRAVRLLQTEGVLEGLPRSRVVVAHPPARRVMVDPDAAWPYGSEPVCVEAVAADAELAVLFGVEAGAPLLRERVERLEPEGQPSHLWDRYSIGGRRTAGRLGPPVAHGRIAAPAEAELLGLPPGSVVLTLTMMYADEDESTSAITILTLPADRWAVRLGSGGEI